MIQLITTFNQFSMRLREFEFCLEKNLQNKYISGVTVFSEAKPKNTNIDYVNLDRRPTYKELIDYANEKYPDKLIGIVNADIFFDNSLLKIIELKKDEAICLTRNSPQIDIDNIQIEKALTSTRKEDNMCFDSFFFYTPTNIKNNEFLIGVFGCDNRFAYELYAVGLKVFNPAKIVNSYHVHKTPNLYDGKGCLQGNYLRVNPIDKMEFDRTQISPGWTVSDGKGGVYSVYPDDWKWVSELSNDEYLERDDIPISIKKLYNRNVLGMKRPKV
jgi:hypothetical protein